MTIPVGWLAPSADCWDSNLIRNLTSDTLYPTGLKFRHHTGFPPYHQAEGTVLIIPGRYYSDHTDKIQDALSSYRWVLGIVTSDEESLFDHQCIGHENARWWRQTPRHGKSYGDARLFGVGFPPHLNDLSTDVPAKDVDVMLVAQNTHVRRNECFAALEKTKGSQFVHATPGFTQSWRDGAGPGDYAFQMMKAKVAPCPSGAVSADSFRLWEALECHTVPIADTVSPVDGKTDYWSRIFDHVPFPVIEDYKNLPGYIADALKGWPGNANRIIAYYMRFKRHMAMALLSDLRELGAL